MIIAEVSIIPIGTSSSSLSDYIADCIRILQDSKLNFQLTPMGTIIEGEWDEVMATIRKMQESVFHKGVSRVVTMLKIDDRRDKKTSMQCKVNAVKSKLHS